MVVPRRPGAPAAIGRPRARTRPRRLQHRDNAARSPPYRRPALQHSAQIVQEADIDDERFYAPEAPELDVVLQGLPMADDDTHTRTIADPVFDIEAAVAT
ncbi:chromate resistance protein ChrB domain-containing protein [Streptomyces anulatus]|uniref:chromate resistance protein ChrB domain-containing protein n=1 Tax=Streptomyces anulatus TaxID=1892 RepID=UPI003723680B